MARRVGAWIIGARGAVSTVAIAGVEALKAGLASTTGLVTAQPEFAGLDLVSPSDLVFGGYDIRDGDLVSSAEEFARENGVLSKELIDRIAPGLRAVTLKRGFTPNAGEAIAKLGTGRTGKPSEIVAQIQADLREFQAANRLDDMVVINLASAEPWFEAPREFATLESFLGLLSQDHAAFPASVLVAQAAMDAGFPYVNFTSSTGASLGALDELSRRRGVPYCGRDAKTGETLVKTVLAPMFVARNLKVLAWEGHNLLGNRDGKVLEAPENLKAKTKDKDEALRAILGTPETHSRVRIDYVPSLGDWKTAWDFIHFEGFLGAKMAMQFVWQGCDSALAAPLAIDLIRLAELSHRLGEKGMMRHTACFWKAPTGVETHDFPTQMAWLYDYAETRRARAAASSAAKSATR